MVPAYVAYMTAAGVCVEGTPVPLIVTPIVNPNDTIAERCSYVVTTVVVSTAFSLVLSVHFMLHCIGDLTFQKQKL